MALSPIGTAVPRPTVRISDCGTVVPHPIEKNLSQSGFWPLKEGAKPIFKSVPPPSPTKRIGKKSCLSLIWQLFLMDGFHSQ